MHETIGHGLVQAFQIKVSWQHVAGLDADSFSFRDLFRDLVDDSSTKGGQIRYNFRGRVQACHERALAGAVGADQENLPGVAVHIPDFPLVTSCRSSGKSSCRAVFQRIETLTGKMFQSFNPDCIKQ